MKARGESGEQRAHYVKRRTRADPSNMNLVRLLQHGLDLRGKLI